MVALVVVAEKVVVGGGALVAGVVVAAEGDGLLHHAAVEAGVFNEAGEDAEAALRGFVEQDVGGFGVADADDAQFVGLDLGLQLDGAREGVLQGDHAVGVEPQGLDGFDVEGVGEVGGPELDAAEALFGGVGLRDGAAPIAGDEAEGEAFVVLGAPFGVDVDQPGGGDVAQVEQHAFTGAGVGLADALAHEGLGLIGLAGVHGEVGADVVAAGDALLLFAGDAVDLVGAGFGHLHQMVQGLAVGVVAQAGAGEGAELQVLLLLGEEVAGPLADDGVAEGVNYGM